jgi:hypothetical protein
MLEEQLSSKYIRRILKCGVFTFIGFIVQEHCESKEIAKMFNKAVSDIILFNLNED